MASQCDIQDAQSLVCQAHNCVAHHLLPIRTILKQINNKVDRRQNYFDEQLFFDDQKKSLYIFGG
jgi:hypothetical protein